MSDCIEEADFPNYGIAHHKRLWGNKKARRMLLCVRLAGASLDCFHAVCVDDTNR